MNDPAAVTVVVLIICVVIVLMRWGKLSWHAQQAVDYVTPQISDLEAQISGLRHRTETQQQTIQALERRVAELEKRLPPAPPP